MKIIFKLPEDDPKNPGVIADCTGDNAGDRVGPTADGFETYGVTGVALIAFLALALGAGQPAASARTLIIWIFVMRILMILTSLVSYFINERITPAKYGKQKDFDPEAPADAPGLAHLGRLDRASPSSPATCCWATSDRRIDADLWWVLSIIISCGTAAGALIPEFTKIFTSTKREHVQGSRQLPQARAGRR